MRVCGDFTFSYPSTRRLPPLPAELQSHLISGVVSIRPDDDTKRAIVVAGVDKVAGTVKLCVDTTGAVVTIATLKASGFEAYDQKLVRMVREWLFRPFLINDKPAAVCSALTFICSWD